MKTHFAQLNGYIKGVDVSTYNGIIDWEAVRASGIEFAMLRAGFGMTADSMFARNAGACNRLGIPCGAYWFSYATSAEQAVREARLCLETIRPYRIEYPVAFDFEYDSVTYAESHGVSVSAALASGLARGFLRTVREAGYIAVNYSNPDFLARYFDRAVQEEFPIWLARWQNSPDLDNPPRRCDIWQYSSSGRVPGIYGDVDLDVCYADYPGNGAGSGMSGEQIFLALSEYLSARGVPAWAEKELAEAKALGITDGSNAAQLTPRYQAAIMALRAAYAAGLPDGV